MDNKPYQRGNVATSDPTPPEEETQRPEKLWNGSDILLIAGTCLFTFIMGLTLTSSLMAQKVPNHPEQALNTVNFTIASLIIEFVVLVGCVYFLGLKRKEENWEAMGLFPLVALGIITAAGIGVLEFLVENGVTYGAQILFQLPANTAEQQMATQGLSWFNLVVLLAIAGFAIPFAEEIFFRGVLYNYFKGRWGIWVAAIVSSLIFAVITFDILNGIASFVLSLFAIWAYERTKSLWGAIIVHIISSLGSLVIFYLLSTPLQHLPVF